MLNNKLNADNQLFVDIQKRAEAGEITPEQAKKEVEAIVTQKKFKEVSDQAVAAGGDQSNSIANFIGWVLFYIASAFSAIVSFLISMMITVAQYNNFLDHKIVITGWQIVRDVCNNFFIIALLIIAVATILRQPGNYQYQQAMPKLLLMAVLINFSKVFTGILIDASQVFTLYFASALSKEGKGIILYALGLYNYYQAGWAGTPDIFGNWQIVLQLLLALILSVIAAVVVISIVGVLIYRIVTLWFLVILSPAAFLAYGIPGQSGRFSQWLGKLSKELIVAPVMLFFLYLSLFAGAVDPVNPQSISGTNGKTLDAAQGQIGVPGTTGASGIDINQTAESADPFGSVTEQLINFGLIIGLMVGSLMAGQQMGAQGSKMAGAGMGKLNAIRNKGTAWTGGKVARTGLTVGGGAIVTAGKILNVIDNPLGRGVQSVGKVGMNWASDLRQKRTKDLVEKRKKQLEKLGMGEKTADEAQRLLESAKTKATSNVAAGAAIGGLAVATGGAALLPILGGAALGGVAGGGVYATGLGANKWAKSRTAAGKGASNWNKVLTSVGTLEGLTTNTTLGAAKSMNKENNDAKQTMTLMKDDPNFLDDASGSSFSSSNKISSAQKKLWDQLGVDATASPDAAAARLNNENWLKARLADHAAGTLADKDINTARGMSKGYAAYKKSGNDVTHLGNIQSELDKLAAAISDPKKLDTTTAYDAKVIASRNTGNGVLGEQRGKLRHEAFSTGKWDGMDIDFRELIDDDEIMAQLKGAGIDFHVNQEGLNIEGDELMTAVANKVNSLLDKDIAALQQKMEKGGALNQTDNRSLERLQATKSRLADPTAIRSLQLQNSGLADYFKATPGEKRTTIAHERLHGAGLQDERSTEELAQHIDEKNLHGATEQIGREAAALEKAGEEITIEKVLQAVRQKDSGNGTTMQRVDVALAKQRDDQKVNDQQKKKITESLPDSEELIQAVKSIPTSLADEISKAKLNGGSTSTLIQSSMVEGSPFKLLMKALTSINDNLKGANKGINALGADIQKVASGVSAQSTPLEIKVAGESIAEALTTVSEEQ